MALEQTANLTLKCQIDNSIWRITDFENKAN